ncbi:MAG: sugar ABC transporter permease [Actinomycetota bacterium]|nr:sugar ABC transporter permease [Actinomycetota bacterium]
MAETYRKKKNYFILLFLAGGFVVYTVFLVVPILHAMFFSLFGGPGIVPKEFVGFQNYIQLFTRDIYSERFFNAFKNTVIFFLIVTFFQNVIGFFIAIMVTRKFSGNTFFRRISFLPTTLSVIVAGFLFTLILNPVWGIFDKFLEVMGLGFLVRPWLGTPSIALVVIAVVTSWQFLGTSIIFYTAGIDAIDKEVLEAARIDGVGPLAEIRYIIFPSILPIVGIVTILIFIGDFTQFDIVYAMTSPYANPQYGTDLFGSLFYRAAFFPIGRGGWGMGMGATVATMIVLIVTIGVIVLMMLFRMQSMGAREEGDR